MRSLWQVETMITEAIKAGEFENLKGSGKPLEIDLSQDLMTAKLKCMGYVPREVALRRKLALLEEIPKNIKQRESLIIEIDILTQSRLGKI